MNNKPKKFAVDELLEDAILSKTNCEYTEIEKWNNIIDFLIGYKKTEEHSEFLWANQVTDIELEDSIEWDTNLKD